MPGPPLMAIGDSLFNGVRSLTIDATLAEWSAPAQLAIALGIANFATPDYPKNVVINFEKWLTEILDIPGVLSDLSSNIAFWNTQPKSKLAQFDNIAIASTTWLDMTSRTWKTADAEIAQINHLVAAGKTTYNDNLDKLFFAFNTRFILNPTGNPDTPAMTSIEIVAARKPQRLVISIGANDGLWPMAFASAVSPGFNKVNGIYGPCQVAAAQSFIAALKALPPEVEHVYLNTLPHPSTVPNMMPPDDDFSHKPGPAGFFPEYENRMGFNYGKLTAGQIAANDQTIIDVQAFLAGLVGTDPRIHFVPVDQMLMKYDFKTNAAGQQVPAPGDIEINNLMIDGGTDATTFEDYWDGGFAGLDGMHPTFVGYNMMAQTILENIVASEPGFHPGDLPTVAEAFASDTLLTRLPDDWDELLYAWRDARELFDIGAPPPFVSVAGGRMQSLMKVVQFKIH